VNIFYLDRDIEQAARFHSDVHIIKMPLESAQILCAALWRYDIPAPYKQSHAGHPCVLWAGDSLSHWKWLKKFGLALCAEYTYRRDRSHACEAVINSLPDNPPITDLGWSDPPQAMPEEYRSLDVVAAYRTYYAGAKSFFPGKGPAIWSKRPLPEFMVPSK
jgi:hypothetical protein